MQAGRMTSQEQKSYKNYHEFEYISPIQSNDNGEWVCQQRPEKLRKTETGKSKKKQNSRTMEWLDQNYTKTEGICLPRCILYNHYLDYCTRTNQEPACAATFGKMIRQKFPGITTRRLGTRGHSKYHYYGIGIRETSPYYHAVYSTKGLTRFSTSFSMEGKNSQSARNIGGKFDFTSTAEYPDISKVLLSFSKEFERYQIEEFLVKHRNHCNDITHAVSQRKFLDVQSIMVTFWRSLPQYCYQLLHNEVLIDIICLGGSVLNKNLIEILIPITNDEINESSLEEMRYVSKHWEEWEMNSLLGLPQIFVKKSLAISHQFAQSVKRQCTFLHLAKTINNILIDSSKVSAMINDISKVDLGSIGSQAFFASTESEGQDSELNAELLKDLKDLLHAHASFDRYISWLDSIVEKKVIKPSKQNGRSTKKRAQDFLLKWSFFGARIMHNLTLNNALSFGSFHVLRMLFDEYILFGVETQFNNEKDQELATIVEKHIRKEARANASTLSTQFKCRRPATEDIMSSTGFQPRASVINQVYSGQSAFSPYASQLPNMFMESPPTAKSQSDYPGTQQFPSDLLRPPGSFYNHEMSPSTSYGQVGLPNILGSVPPTNPVQSANNYICDGDQIFATLDSFQSDIFQTTTPQTSVAQQSQQSQNSHSNSFGVTVPEASSHQCVSVISMASRSQPEMKVMNSFHPNGDTARVVSSLDEITTDEKVPLDTFQSGYVNVKSASDATGMLGAYDNYIDTIPMPNSMARDCDQSCSNNQEKFPEEFYDSSNSDAIKRQLTTDRPVYPSLSTAPITAADFQDY